MHDKHPIAGSGLGIPGDVQAGLGRRHCSKGRGLLPFALGRTRFSPQHCAPLLLKSPDFDVLHVEILLF